TAPADGARYAGGSQGTGYQQNGAQAHQAVPAYANGNGTPYAANGNGYPRSSVNGSDYPSVSGSAPANGYPGNGYAADQSAAAPGAEYAPMPDYATAGQPDEVQHGYWDQEQQRRGNWS
ncbi:MAG: hypothetical protein ACRDNS_33615, partial [Trebonia sp.]